LSIRAQYLFPRLLFCLLLSASAPFPAFGQNATQLEAELTELRKQIEQINQRLVRQRDQQQTEQSALAEIERTLGQLARELRTTRADLARTRQQVQIAAQRGLLAEQLRVAYRIGIQSRIRAMLSGQDPNDIARRLALHGYLGRARLQSVSTLNEQIEQLDQLLEQERRSRAELTQLLQTQQEQTASQERVGGGLN